MKANQNFQDQAMRIAQLIETLIADAGFQRHAGRIADHMEAIRAQVTSQKTDGGPSQDSFSLAEVKRLGSGASFFPPGLTTGMRTKARGARAPAPQMAAGKGQSTMMSECPRRSAAGIRFRFGSRAQSATG